MQEESAPSYLLPYCRAARVHGAAFPSLLWASPTTQALRFEAITRIVELRGKSVLDAGCGRADLLLFLNSRGIPIGDYVGIEAVPELAAAAEKHVAANVTIIRADFIRDPARLFVGADTVIFSGSLNTADDNAFYETLARARDATADMVIFNFLASPILAAKDYLAWRRPADVLRFVRRIGADVRMLDDYLPGDCTIAFRA
jgi:SAM-dependent methyltransferase